jgi:hypothetical protein
MNMKATCTLAAAIVVAAGVLAFANASAEKPQRDGKGEDRVSQLETKLAEMEKRLEEAEKAAKKNAEKYKIVEAGGGAYKLHVETGTYIPLPRSSAYTMMLVGDRVVVLDTTTGQTKVVNPKGE